MKVNAAAVAKPIPQDTYLLKLSFSFSCCTLLYYFILSFVNSHMELHCQPPYDFCVRTHPVDIKPNILGLLMHYAPFMLMIICNLYLDHCTTPKFQRPLVQHSHIIIHPLLDHSPLRSSYISVLFVAMGSFQEGFLLETHLSHHVKSLSMSGVTLLFFLVKGPLWAIWAKRVEQENLTRAQENLQLMDIQLHHLHQPNEI